MKSFPTLTWLQSRGKGLVKEHTGMVYIYGSVIMYNVGEKDRMFA